VSRVERALQQLCPNGVPYVPLGQVGEFVRGNGLQKTDLRDSGVPAIHYGQIHTRYGVTATETFSYVAPELARRLRQAEPGDLVLATTSEDDTAVGKAVAWLGSSAAAVSGDAYIYRHELDPRYVSYFLQSRHFQTQKLRGITGTKVRRISGERLSKILIPVPPLDVQREIGRTLDSLNSLDAELRMELKLRQSQYVHYRDLLMLFDEQLVERRPLGAIATVVRGASPRPISRYVTESDDGVPWIKIGDVTAGGKYITGTAQKVTQAGAAKSRRVRPGDFVLSNSMSFGRPYISRIEGCIHDGWLAISRFEESYIPDFLYHLLRSMPVQVELARRAGAGTVQNLNADIVRSVALPVPPREDQERIVALLDKFDLLVNDTSIGLPAEIAARRTQYEYYRDRLLTFEGRAA
jgi:type I restriction enzyme S subunit